MQLTSYHLEAAKLLRCVYLWDQCLLNMQPSITSCISGQQRKSLRIIVFRDCMVLCHLIITHSAMSNFKSELKGLNRFQPIPRDLIQDCGLSAQARFIYAYMAAKPEGWEFWQDVMSREVGMSVATLRKYLHELRDAGWLEIGGQKHNKGFGSVQYTLKALCYKNCDTQNLCDTKIVTHENRDTQNLSHLNNTDALKDIDTLKKKKSESTPAPLILPFSSDRFRETWNALCEEKEWKKKTRNALQLALNKLGRYDEAFAIQLMEATIEGGWKGVVFPDTDAKYQEWKSARQQRIDNQTPRTAVVNKPRQLPADNNVDAMYAKLRAKKEAEERELQDQLKKQYGDAYRPSGGQDDQ